MRSDFNVERAKKMEDLYRGGKTLEEVGKEYGLTRERVRQILKKVGVPSSAGGATQRAKDRTQKRAADQDARYLKRWGCTKAQWEYLRAFDKKRDKTPIGRFCEQRNNAKHRGVEWRLTLWQWWKIWEMSGRWGARGRNDGEYVMCRYGDSGPYEVGNVCIRTCNDNISEYWHGAGGVTEKIHYTYMCRSPEKQLIDAEENL